MRTNSVFIFAVAFITFGVIAVVARPTLGKAAVGSVVQSWVISSLPLQCDGVARDANYIYGFFHYPDVHIRTFTPTGSLIASVAMPGLFLPGGASRSHLGAGYVCVVDAVRVSLFQVSLATGSAVSYFAVTPGGGGALRDCAFNGTYYFAKGSNDGKTFARYTTAGASAGTWTASGCAVTACGGVDWTQYLSNANNGGSGYMAVYSEDALSVANVVSYPGGSLVTWWDHPGTLGNRSGCYVGAASATGYGERAWVNIAAGSNQRWCYEVDLGNGGGAVAPASVGRIKALYR